MRFTALIRSTALISVLMLAPAAFGQLRPVVGGGATAFDPEVSVVHSGAVFDAQAVISADRKYVTINAIPQQSNVIAFREFQVSAVAAATGFGGFVGGADPGGGVAAIAEQPVSIVVVATNPTPAERNDPAILNRPGMIRLLAR